LIFGSFEEPVDIKAKRRPDALSLVAPAGSKRDHDEDDDDKKKAQDTEPRVARAFPVVRPINIARSNASER
jgi:hypothetical protein